MYCLLLWFTTACCGRQQCYGHQVATGREAHVCVRTPQWPCLLLECGAECRLLVVPHYKGDTGCQSEVVFKRASCSALEGQPRSSQCDCFLTRWHLHGPGMPGWLHAGVQCAEARISWKDAKPLWWFSLRLLEPRWKVCGYRRRRRFGDSLVL